MTNRRRNIISIVAALGLLLTLGLLTGTRGGLCYFSPDTLECKSQSEFTVLCGRLTIYRSAAQKTDNELLAYLLDEGLVEPQSIDNPRWVSLYHWNYAWKDGYSLLSGIFLRHRSSMLQWSRDNPEVARIYWSVGFKYLRGQSELERTIGHEILTGCRGHKSVAELKECIAKMEKEVTFELDYAARVRAEAAGQ